MQLTLFPENAHVESLDAKDNNRNIREEILRRLTDCKKIREIKLQENSLLARLVL